MKIIFISLILGYCMTVLGVENKVFKGTAVFHIKKDKVVEFKNEVLKIISPTRKEKGCITYDAYQVVDDSGNLTNVFEFHETWSSKEAMLVDHKENAPHMKIFFEKVGIGKAESWIDKVDISGHYVEIL